MYEERLAELLFPITGTVWPGAAASEREEAAANGYLQAIQPTKIVLESTEADENGKRKRKLARLYATPAGAAPATPAPANGNGHPATAPADAIPACPKCGGSMWDNCASKKSPAAPDFKCNAAGCDAWHGHLERDLYRVLVPARQRFQDGLWGWWAAWNPQADRSFDACRPRYEGVGSLEGPCAECTVTNRDNCRLRHGR